MQPNLVIYFSHRGPNYVRGEILDLEQGNTEIVAGYICEAVGADMFEVRTVREYARDYRRCCAEAKAELDADARPDLIEYLVDVSGYDNIFVCGPCWCGPWPMPVFSALERLDLSGKRVFPVMTHEGSGFGHALRDLPRVCEGADIRPGLTVIGADARDSGPMVREWAVGAVRPDGA